MTTQVPEERVRLLRSRDNAAIEALVEECTGPLFAAARALGFSEVDSEELVQETFVALLSAIDRFEGRSRFKTFIFGILYNKAHTFKMKHGREPSADPQEPEFRNRFDSAGMWITPPRGPEEAALSDEIRDWVRRCAENLPLTQRAALYLREIDGEEPEAVCNVLQVAGTNLRVLLHRARARMRDCLEKHWNQR